MTMREKFLQYLAREKQASKHTVNSYDLDLQQFIQLMAGDDREFDNWAKFSRDDARSYLQELHKLSLSRNSIARKLSSMRSFYKFLQLSGAVESNIFMRLPAQGRERKLPQVMSLNSIEVLIKSVESYWQSQLANNLAKNAQQMRYALIFSSILWVIHDFYVQSYPTVISGCFLIAWTIVQILKQREVNSYRKIRSFSKKA